MAINDILPQFDPIPGLTNDQRQDVAQRETGIGNSDSEYRRALSRTLKDRGRKETPTADAKTPPESPQRPTTDERQGQTQSANPRPTRTTDEPNRATPSEGEIPATIANEGRPAEIDEPEVAIVDAKIETPEPTVDAVIESPVDIAIASTPVELLADNQQLPKPPADLSSLFSPTPTDEESVFAGVPVEVNGDDTLRPPSGLFKSPVVNDEREDNTAALLQAQAAGANREGGETRPDTVLLQVEQTIATEVVTPDNTENSEFLAESPKAESPKQDAELAQRDLAETTGVTSNSVSESSTALEESAINSRDRESSPEVLDSSNSHRPGSATPVATNLPADDSSTRGSLARVEQLSEQKTEQGEAAAVAIQSADVKEETNSQRGIEPVRLDELVGNNGAANRKEVEIIGESTVVGESPKHSVSVVSGGAPAVLPVQDTRSAAVTSGLPLVDPEQLVERVATGIRTAPQNGVPMRVKLYPPNLGQLQIEVTSNGGRISVRMEVQSVAAQNALSDNMSLLREAIVQQGSTIDRIDVQLVETNAEEGRSDLTEEQQQQARQERSEEQSQQDEEELAVVEDSNRERQPIPIAAGMKELDIQV